MNLLQAIWQFVSLVKKCRPYAASGFLFAVVAIAAGCSTDPDEGGIIGSGMRPVATPPPPADTILHGVVHDAQFADNNTVEIKSSDGQLTSVPITSASRYTATSLNGDAPWVLRVNLNTDRAVYGIAFDTETRNINRFTDISLRQWFAQNQLDLDAEFTAIEAFTALPTASEYAQSVSNVFGLINPVLASYDATAGGVISGDYALEPLGDGEPGTGTNAFLQNTTVLLDNQTFRFAITDPATNTQSTTQSANRLGNNLVDTSSDAPSKPESVRALGGAIDEVILVWEPSIDDIAVVGYRVERDGVLVATTPYPVYIDSGLAVQEYSYEITAIDAAGNESEASTPVVVSPLQASDTTPPPAPTVLLEVDTLDSTIHLIWAQPIIEDVVSFNVFRGNDAQSLALHVRVTSNDAIDALVIPGQTYCYQVEAVDSSGNTSERSEVLCVEASGPRPDEGVNNDPLIDWVIPDVGSLNCSQSIGSEPILQGLSVVTRGCYTVPETLYIGPGATLRLTAGVVLVFGTDAGLVVTPDGTLTADGTVSDPVVFTGNLDLPGAWSGIEFADSRSFGNLLKGAVIQYAGGETGGSREAGISAYGKTRLRIEDTLVQFNQNRAFHFSGDEILVDEFTGNQIRGNESIGEIVVHLLPSLAGNSDFRDNLDSKIEVPFNIYGNSSIIIPNLGVPLRWNGIRIEGGTLTIDPGVELSMVQGSTIEVDGTFNAAGSPNQPIVMHGINTSSDRLWGGVLLSGRGDKTFNYVQLQYGGDNVRAGQTGSIDVRCRIPTAAKVSIDNTDIADSSSWGIYIDGDGCDIDIGENVTFFENAIGDIRLP